MGNDSSKYSYCNVYGATDVGCKRAKNEDWLGTFECRNGLVSVVCDGMGGHVGGEKASHLAVESITAFLHNNDFADPFEAIVQACDHANAKILEFANTHTEYTGMGATCVMLIVRNGKVYIGSVGDSRVYIIRSKVIRQLTKDQSYVQTLVDAGEITAEQAEHHPRKNEITNALGIPGMTPATVLETPIDPEAGDIFLLCSDGLSGMVSDRVICKIASQQREFTQQQRVNKLIETARQNGGLDNITCQMVEFAVTPGASSATRPTIPMASVTTDRKPSHWLRGNRLLCGIAIGAIVAGMAVWLFPGKKEKPPVPKPEPKSEIYISEYAKSKLSQPRTVSIPIRDTVLFKPGAKLPFIDIVPITENGNGDVEYYEMIVRGYNNQDRTYKLPKNINPKTVSVEPSQYVRVTDGFNTQLTFHTTSFDSEGLALTFVAGDSTYIYSLRVMNQAEINQIIQVRKEAARKAMEEAARKAQKEAEKKAGATESKGAETASTQTQPGHTVNVKLTGGNAVIHLHGNKNGTNTDNDIYLPTYHAVLPKEGVLHGVGFSGTINGNDCVITVNSNFQSGNSIKIPIMFADGTSGEYTLTVKKAH